MSTLWIVGQAGIFVEVLGAGLGVWYAWQTRRQWLNAPSQATYDSLSDDLARPRQEFIAQYPKQMAVFGIIAVGLVLQFVGNFSNA